MARDVHAGEKATMERLASMPATTRKIDNFSRLSAAKTATTEAAAPYTIVDLDAVNDLFESLRRYWCRGAVKLVRGDREYRLAVKLSVVRQLRRHRSDMELTSHRRVSEEQPRKAVTKNHKVSVHLDNAPGVF